MTSETTPQGTVTYGLDDADRRPTMTVAGQPQVSYTWDNADRLTQITRGSLQAVYGYDIANRRTSLQLPNLVTIAYGYDDANRLTGLTYSGLVGGNQSLTYGYDAASNRTLMSGSWARTLLPDAISGASYDAANRQLTLGSKTMTYDNNGNLETLTEGVNTTTYTRDVRDRLTGLTGPGLSASFAYDQSHRRTQKTVAAFSTTFQYDGLDIVREVAGGAEVNYLRGLDIDEPLARIEASGTTCFLGDALDSTMALSDNAGAVTTEYTYEPFGRTTATGAATQNSLQYTARENDGTGLYYYRARYYHPSLMRFIAEDPIGLDGGDINFYAYVSGNPLGLADPTGLATCGCDVQLPPSPTREVALTCFAEATARRCRRSKDEKRAITDTVYNRQRNIMGDRPGSPLYGTFGNPDIPAILEAEDQYEGYGPDNDKYRRARAGQLSPVECQQLKDCIDAAQASARGTRFPYTHFRPRDYPRDARRICDHWFWTRPRPRGRR